MEKDDDLILALHAVHHILIQLVRRHIVGIRVAGRDVPIVIGIASAVHLGNNFLIGRFIIGIDAAAGIAVDGGLHTGGVIDEVALTLKVCQVGVARLVNVLILVRIAVNGERVPALDGLLQGGNVLL